MHTQTDDSYIDSERILLVAIEAAILDHATRHSDWWQKNRERLCFNPEGALCYFAVLAVRNSPEPNLDLIGRLLCDKNLLGFKLSFELCTLIHAAFILLDDAKQDAVMTAIQTVGEEPATDGGTSFWILKRRAEYISAIPCHLRSPEAQAILDAYEKIYGPLIRQPSIGVRGGTVSAPFSLDVFLNVSDAGVIRLLTHYADYHHGFDDFLVGGKREVGLQLREASSRHPSRFLGLMITHWANISADFRDDIMEGIVTNLAHRYGDLQPNGIWIPREEPDAPALGSQILDELERHPYPLATQSLHSQSPGSLRTCYSGYTHCCTAGGFGNRL